MEWLYILGFGLNGWGFTSFLRKTGPFDNTPILNSLKNSSAIGGMIFLIIGILVFDGWVPFVAVLVAPIVVHAFLASSHWMLITQTSIMLGLLLCLIAVITVV